MATFLIQDVYNITGIGIIPVGIVKGGVLKIGMKLQLEGRVMEIKKMEMKRKGITEAKEGDNVGLTLFPTDYLLLKKFINSIVEFN